MYGLLLEGIYYYLKTVFGESVLREIRLKANVQQASFSTHHVYSESVMPRLAHAAEEVTGIPYDDVMEAFGANFVSHVSTYGYDRILKVLGRSLRDFLNNLDNLHEYLRFSYPKIRAPSFFVTHESPNGLTLHYRSKRQGFAHYIKGQVIQVAKLFYNTAVDVAITTCDEGVDLTTVEMRVTFDNGAYTSIALDTLWSDGDFPITSTDLYKLFPFHVLIDRQLVIRSVGASLGVVLPGMVGSQLDDRFRLERPVTELTWDNIIYHLNNVFQLKSISDVTTFSADATGVSDNASESGHTSCAGEIAEDSSDVFSERQNDGRISLKGQMVHMKTCQAMLFLATPIMTSLNHMFDVGLYMTDFSLHDSNRELILAGPQQSAELKLLLSQELSKSKKLEDSMKKLDMEMKRTDQLLYQMIPKAVADRLRHGELPINTCEIFNGCTVLFSDVVGFTNICSQITPMQVVAMLNTLYTCFDTIIESHLCYKVETIGDAYMVVGGVPTRSTEHAREVADMAFDMLRTMKTMKDPSDASGKSHLNIKIGIHSGMVVAGVVGVKTPRYCLFGDTVNTASRMETTGEAMKIQTTCATKSELSRYPQYITTDRGTVEVKGKGLMNTFWLSRSGSAPSENGFDDSNFNLPRAVLPDTRKGNHPVKTGNSNYDLGAIDMPDYQNTATLKAANGNRRRPSVQEAGYQLDSKSRSMLCGRLPNGSVSDRESTLSSASIDVMLKDKTSGRKCSCFNRSSGDHWNGGLSAKTGLNISSKKFNSAYSTSSNECDN